MRNNSFEEIYNLLYQLEKTDQYVRELQQIDKEELNQSILNSFHRKKRKLVKKLLLEMLNNGVNIARFEHIYNKIFTYLKVEDANNVVSKEQEEALSQLESTLSL